MRDCLAFSTAVALALLTSDSFASDGDGHKFLSITTPCIIGDQLPVHFAGHDPEAFVDLLSKAKTRKDGYETTAEYETRMRSLLPSLSPSPALTLCFRDDFTIATYNAEKQSLRVALDASDHSGLRDVNGASQKLVFVELKTLTLHYRTYNAPIKGGFVVAQEGSGDLIRLASPYNEFFANFGKQKGVNLWEGQPTLSINPSLYLEIHMPGKEAREVNEKGSQGEPRRLAAMHVVQLIPPYFAETKEHKVPRTRHDLESYNFNEKVIMATQREIVVFDDGTGRILGRVSSKD